MPIFRASIPYTATVQITTRTAAEALEIAKELGDNDLQYTLLDADEIEYNAYFSLGFDGCTQIELENMEQPK